MTFVFATNNSHKLEEVRHILGDDFGLLTPSEVGITEEIPETCATIEGNALQKAKYIYEATGKNCFADDTGLEVFALGGEPGVRSARYAGDGHDFQANTDLLLKNLLNKPDRSARFRTVIALIIDGNEYCFEGEVRGRITEERSGGKGFGYDPVFVPDGYEQTFAEMDPELKNTISHRAVAISKFSEFLKNTDKI